VTRAIAAVVAVLALTAGVIYLARPKDSGPDPKAWEAKAQAAFKPVVDDLPGLLQAIRDWQAGQRSTEDLRPELARDRQDFARSRDRVTALDPAPKAPQTKELYQATAQLYVEVVRSYQVMTDTPTGDLRGQLDLQARRLRELADRVFDRGRAAIAPYVGREQPSKDIEIRLPEEVPMWVEEGMAAGPPLDEPPLAPAASPPLRQDIRPEESAAAWARDVRQAGVPSDGELRRAIGRLDAAALQRLADRFTEAAERLRGRPDPKGGREKGAILRLSLLVSAEAARAAQAATFVTGPVAQELHLSATAIAGAGAGVRRVAGL
jgi:hypothetical protein